MKKTNSTKKQISEYPKRVGESRLLGEGKTGLKRNGFTRCIKTLCVHPALGLYAE